MLLNTWNMGKSNFINTITIIVGIIYTVLLINKTKLIHHRDIVHLFQH